MSNTIQIKHGSGNPAGKLQPYELGYSDDGCLYIGTDKNTVAKLTDTKVTGLVNSNNYLVLPTITNANSDTDKFLVCDSSGQVKFRTGENILSDIGALSTSGKNATDSLTVNEDLITKTLILKEGNWGNIDPNDAEIAGTNGQLYFVLV